ncbi:hypothetical protein GLOIN_2v1778313 [Rhizophagus clarus]|uniref:Uncharacterized protein n=1 Tax=Rhizophagus clarus TaxID=94130 RepID=A0A8H3LFZ8_9GLOM|nr:hypothetical protein GLOIN_2v1778313 [Rhizophagus clarus]
MDFVRKLLRRLRFVSKFSKPKIDKVLVIHIVLFHLRLGNLNKFEDKAKIARWAYIGVDVIINIFITIRLAQILREGIQNSSELDKRTEEHQRTN